MLNKQMSKKTRTKSKGITRRTVLRSAAAGGVALSAGLPIFNIARAQDNKITYGMFGEPSGLNEFMYTEIHGSVVTTNIYDKMAQINYATHQSEPEIVEFKNEDPLTWVLKVREGVKFHKGYGDLTDEDILYCFNHVQEASTFQKGITHFPVVGAKRRSKNVVEVKLSIPFSAFPMVTMGYGGSVMCKAAHMEMGDQEYARNPIGTGPFEFDSWVSGSHMILKKNQNYWREGEPYVDEIVYRTIVDPSVRLSSLLTGEIDIMPRPDPKDIARFRDGSEPGIAYQSVPGWNWDYMDFTLAPHSPADFPTNNVDVRRAISYAIDRQTIVDEIYAGEALVTDNPVPPGYLGHRPSPIVYPARGDIAKAKELMAKAGVSGFDLEVITSDKEWLRRECELVSAMLSEIGINVKIKGMDAGTYGTAWFTKQFQADLEDITIVSPDVDSALWWFHHKDGMVEHGWQNAQVSKWLDEGRSELDPAKRTSLYHNIVDAVLDDCPYIYFNHVNQVYLLKDNLEGFKAGPQEHVVPLRAVRWA
jgi:peptide/nickel transport system substrate-binding protein